MSRINRNTWNIGRNQVTERLNQQLGQRSRAVGLASPDTFSLNTTTSGWYYNIPHLQPYVNVNSKPEKKYVDPVWISKSQIYSIRLYILNYLPIKTELVISNQVRHFLVTYWWNRIGDVFEKRLDSLVDAVAIRFSRDNRTRFETYNCTEYIKHEFLRDIHSEIDAIFKGLNKTHLRPPYFSTIENPEIDYSKEWKSKLSLLELGLTRRKNRILHSDKSFTKLYFETLLEEKSRTLTKVVTWEKPNENGVTVVCFYGLPLLEINARTLSPIQIFNYSNKEIENLVNNYPVFIRPSITQDKYKKQDFYDYCLNEEKFRKKQVFVLKNFSIRAKLQKEVILLENNESYIYPLFPGKSITVDESFQDRESIENGLFLLDTFLQEKFFSALNPPSTQLELF